MCGKGRVGEGVASLPSHRSGRARLRHPARRITGSQRTGALGPQAKAARTAAAVRSAAPTTTAHGGDAATAISATNGSPRTESDSGNRDCRSPRSTRSDPVASGREPRIAPGSAGGGYAGTTPRSSGTLGLGTRCLRFVEPVTGTRRKTRFRPLARLYRVGLLTHRVPTKGFRG